MTNPQRQPLSTARRLGPLGMVVVLVIGLLATFTQSPDAPSTVVGHQPVRAEAPAAAPAKLTQAPARWETTGGAAITDPAQVQGIWDTLQRIQRGPPYPHRQDGAVFQNREGRLQRHPAGWWHEYTVVTPGAGDRGARRLVVGSDGEIWYTDDHYRTFRNVRPP